MGRLFVHAAMMESSSQRTAQSEDFVVDRLVGGFELLLFNKDLMLNKYRK